MKPVCIQPISLSFVVGFINNLAQMLIMIRQCVANIKHVAGPNVKVTGYNEILSYPTHNFVLHGGISNYMLKCSVAHKDQRLKGQGQKSDLCCK